MVCDNHSCPCPWDSASSRCQHTSTYVKNLSKISNTQKSTLASAGVAFWASTIQWRLMKSREYLSFPPGFDPHLYVIRLDGTPGLHRGLARLVLNTPWVCHLSMSNASLMNFLNGLTRQVPIRSRRHCRCSRRHARHQASLPRCVWPRAACLLAAELYVTRRCSALMFRLAACKDRVRTCVLNEIIHLIPVPTENDLTPLRSPPRGRKEIRNLDHFRSLGLVPCIGLSSVLT